MHARVVSETSGVACPRKEVKVVSLGIGKDGTETGAGNVDTSMVGKVAGRERGAVPDEFHSVRA